MSIGDLRASTVGPSGPLAEPDMDRTLVGASPIFTHVWPDSADLNDRLRQVVLDRMATDPGLKKSNCGGWQSQRNLQLWGGDPVEELLGRVNTMLRSVLKETVPGAGEDLLGGWDVEAWANVNQLGDTVAAHNHAGGVNMWAAIYYVDTGDRSDEPASGFTRYMDMSGIPRPVGRSAPAIPVPTAVGSRQDNCAGPERTGDDHDLQLIPQAGKMVIFPATLPHYVTAYLGSEKRITIAFNLRHTKFVVADFETPYSRRRTMWRDYRGPMLVAYDAKRRLRTGLASVVPVERWPEGVKRRLLGGAS